MKGYKFTKESTGATLIIESVNIYEAKLRLSKLVDNANEYKYIKDV